jgi:hypothetical protein
VITTRASGEAAPRSVTTKRRTLEYRAAKPWSSTKSCQMAIALRPRPSASAISSRYASHALALGARPGRGTRAVSVDTSDLVAGFATSESVDTSAEIAGVVPHGLKGTHVLRNQD